MRCPAMLVACILCLGCGTGEDLFGSAATDGGTAGSATVGGSGGTGASGPGGAGGAGGEPPMIECSPTGSTYVDEVLADGPLAYWRLGEQMDAMTAVDASSRMLDATYLSGLEYGVEPLIADPTNTAVRATDGVLNAGLSDAFIVDSITAEVWVSPSSSAARQAYWNIAGSNADVFILRETNGAIAFFVEAAMADDSVRTPAGAVPDGQTTHLVATYDEEFLRIYVNGIMAAESQHAQGGPISWSGQATAALIFGSAGGSDPFRGVADEVSVYGEALSGERICEHYLAGGGDAMP